MDFFNNIFSKITSKDNFENLNNFDIKDLTNKFIDFLGGKENIKNIYFCSTRLRVEILKDKIDIKKIKDLGFKKIIKLNNFNYQFIIGKNIDILEKEINKYLGD